MSPYDVDHETLVENLLRQARRESADAPSRFPFWREGPWRCEYHESVQPARLKVFKGESCVHEEAVEDPDAAAERCTELKRVFLEGQQDGSDDTLLH